MQITDQAVAIAVEHVSKSFGPTRALIDANLIVRQGESRALLGRNGAGKSTLIAMLTGLLEPDAGEIRVTGEGGVDEGPGADSIACVYQKSTLVPWLSAAENISLGAYPTTSIGAVDWRAIRSRAVSLLSEWGYESIANRIVDELPPLERKIVEICRAMSRGPKVLLLDEPTAGLDEGGVRELFIQIGRARERGVTVLYVSHHLEEVFEVCDGVTVLRDGRDVLTAPTEGLTVDDIVVAMSGEPIARVEARTASTGPLSDEIVLEVDGARIGSVVQGVSLSVRRGESVGITGLDGAGHIQLAESLAGQRPLDDGIARIHGAPIRSGQVDKAIRSGIGFVPEDRHEGGFVPALSVEENTTLTILDRILTRVGLVSGSKRRSRYDQLSTAWSIKAERPSQAAEELSGGNQQKVVLARALASDPEVVVLLHPTAGVDVTAKNSIYETLHALQASGRSLLIASTDDDDLAICDRVIVMSHGQITAELSAGYSEHELVSAVQGGTVTASIPTASTPPAARAPKR